VSAASQPGWFVIAKHEVADLWLSAKGLSVLLGVTVLLALLSYLGSADAAINLLDARESVDIIVRTAIGLGTLSALVVSADAISGERERGTLEALLVTPVSRRDIVVGKLVGASTMWMASLLASLPFVIVMASGPALGIEATVVMIVAGTLVAAALTALGLAVSAVSMSNRVSLTSSVALLLLLVIPSQLPAVKSNALANSVFVKANPVSAGLQLANNILVRRQAWTAQWDYLLSPVIAAVGLTMLAVALSNRLELGGSR
jgi:ABC-2 type transport system permease protein